MIAKLAWYWPFITYTIETALALLLIILLIDETYYDRSIPTSQRPSWGTRFQRLVGIAQRTAKQPSNMFLEAMTRPVKTVCKPVILMTNAFYLMTFAWAVGINSTLTLFLTTVYGFSTTSIGTLLTAPPHSQDYIRLTPIPS